jgi:hypothetical protein
MRNTSVVQPMKAEPEEMPWQKSVGMMPTGQPALAIEQVQQLEPASPPNHILEPQRQRLGGLRKAIDVGVEEMIARYREKERRRIFDQSVRARSRLD